MDRSPANLLWGASLLAGMDPWIRLQRTAEQALENLQDPLNQLAFAFAPAGERAGLIAWTTCGLLNGYIRTVAVEPCFQGQGLGRTLVAFAEERILRESPNVFICVSSFNARARRL